MQPWIGYRGMRRQLMDRELDDRDTPDMNLTSQKPRRGVIVSRVARLQSDPTDRSSRCSSLLRTFGFLVQKALLMRESTGPPRASSEQGSRAYLRC